MASSKEYVNFILEQLSELEEVRARSMMGEYLLYYRGKIAGNICDDRLLVKPVDSAVVYLRELNYQKPYEGAKDMLLVDDVDDRAYLVGLFNAIYDELPEPKPKKSK